MTTHSGQYVSAPIFAHKTWFEPGFYLGGSNSPHYVVGLSLYGITAYGMGHESTISCGRIDAGDIYFCAPDLIFRFWSPEEQTPWKVIYCLFTSKPHLIKFIDYEASDPRCPGFTKFQIQDNITRRMIYKSFHNIIALSSQNIAIRHQLQYMELEKLLLWARHEHSPQTRAIDPRVKKAIGIIQSKPSASMTVSQLAKMCGTSRSRLSEAFSKQMGCAPMQFWERCRIERAMDMLRLTHQTIDYIADELGYSNRSHFAKRFKAVTGASPAAFRQHNQPS